MLVESRLAQKGGDWVGDSGCCLFRSIDRMSGHYPDQREIVGAMSLDEHGRGEINVMTDHESA